MGNSQEPKKVSKQLKTFFGVGEFGFTLMSNIDTFYATFFFTNIAKFAPGIVAVMTTISAVVDAILSMFYGAFLNKVKAPKWGRYRSWLIITPWMVPILYACQFVKLGNGLAAIIFATAAMITSRIAWNIPFIASLSMINVAGKTPEDRMALSSIRSVWTSAGSVIYSYLGPAVVAVFAGILGEKHSFAATAFAFGVLMAAGMYAHFVMFRGYEPTGEEAAKIEAAMKAKQPENAGAKAGIIDSVKCNSHLVWLMVSSMMKYILLFLVNGMAIYYFTYITNNVALFSTFVFAANLLGIAASYLARFVVAKLNARNTEIVCYILMGACGLAAYLFRTQTIVVIVLMAAVMFFMYITNTCDPELFANCAAYSGKKLGCDVTGTVMGLLTVPLKLGIVARGILISACLSIGAYTADMADMSYFTAEKASELAVLQNGVCIGFMVIPAICILAGALMMFFGYHLGENENK